MRKGVRGERYGCCREERKHEGEEEDTGERGGAMRGWEWDER